MGEKTTEKSIATAAGTQNENTSLVRTRYKSDRGSDKDKREYSHTQSEIAGDPVMAHSVSPLNGM